MISSLPKQENKLVGGRRLRGMEKQGAAETPLVSIVTIVRNGEEYIGKTIESVLQQSYDPIEYIIIDGRSEDNTVSILREYDEKIDLWQSEPDEGISDAFNKGIRAARGNIIGLINCGDWYAVDAVQRVVDVFSANREVGVVCGALQFWKGEGREYCCYSVPRLLEREMTITHPTCFIRSALYHRFGLYSTDYRLAMDYELLLRFKRQGVQFLSLEAVLANMQHDGTSEVNWKNALLETHRARVALLGNSFFAGHGYYLFLTAKRQLRIVLEKLGWNGLIRVYRSRLALVKKYKT
ncbi:MAG: glycosyltransferase [Desulfobulbaceae bacterium]|nr:glycosyltransferase [Desulfobulbaceae bacterium]